VSQLATWAAILGIGTATAPSDFTPAGSIDTAPAEHWVRALPGLAFPAARHTELGTPLIHGGEIYVGSAASDVLHILSRRDGSIVGSLSAQGPVQAAPVVQGNRIYFTDSAGYTWCYPLDGGDAHWRHYGGAPILSEPRVVDGQVFVSNVGGVSYALDAESGALQWRHEQEVDITRRSQLELYGTPTPLLNGETVLLGAHDGSVVALDKAKGLRLWQRKVGEGRYPDIIGALVVREADVIVAGFTEPLVSLNIETQNVRWRLDAGGVAAPLVVGREVYHGGSDGKLRRVDAVTGSVGWTWECSVGGTLGRPVQTDAGLLIASSEGSVYLVDAGNGDELWSYQPGHLLDGVTAGIAVEGRQAIIVTNAGNVVSLLVPQSGNSDE
jgi:outer membrane protein assembly factor BamB